MTGRNNNAVNGTCRLCLAGDLPLQDSHFMPAGLYRIVSESRTAHPVLIQSGAAVLTASQARAHMLCSACERRFDKGGEEWVIENCWRDATTFPMRATLLASEPFQQETGFSAFNAKRSLGTDFEKLVYFAGSVFWRGCLTGWRFGQGTTERLVLGPYEEQLRRFLLGATPFPANILLIISASLNQDDRYNRQITLPHPAGRAAGGHRFMFVLPGLTVLAIIGGRLSDRARQISTMPAGFLYVSGENDDQRLLSMVLATQKAPRRGKLARL